jgi:hypothetical protein
MQDIAVNPFLPEFLENEGHVCGCKIMAFRA